MALPALSLKARALRWLAQREHSRVELRRKLLPHARAEAVASRVAAARTGAAVIDAGFDPDGEAIAAAAAAAERVDALLDWLEHERHLSPERFAESRIHSRAARLGGSRIEAELAEHGLALSPEQRFALQASEFDRARRVWQRRFGTAPADRSQAARQCRFLLARGFAPEVVHRVVRGADESPD